MEIIKLTDYRASFLSLCALFPIYLDAFICLLARFYNKENVFLSHKKHLYQRLVALDLVIIKLRFYILYAQL